VASSSNATVLPDGVHQESCKVAGKTWTFETGRLARLAHGSCVVTVGGTSVLSTAVVDPNPQPEADGVPLQVRGIHWLALQCPLEVQQ
jgi:polyribonucleotide nucleotidyltransferase